MTQPWFLFTLAFTFGMGWFCCSYFEELKRSQDRSQPGTVRRMLDEQEARRWDDNE